MAEFLRGSLTTGTSDLVSTRTEGQEARLSGNKKCARKCRVQGWHPADQTNEGMCWFHDFVCFIQNDFAAKRLPSQLDTDAVKQHEVETR